MRLSREAKAYAAAIARDDGKLLSSSPFPGEIVNFTANLEKLAANAFQAGMNHAEARQRALARLSKPKESSS
jgi:hypothetical protein